MCGGEAHKAVGFVGVIRGVWECVGRVSVVGV